VDFKVWRDKETGPFSVCFLLVVLSLAWSSIAQAAQITFLTHSVGEQTYVDNEGILHGKEHAGRRAFNIELVQEMMQIMGHPKDIEELPFKRGLLLVQSNADYALFNVNRTEKREKTMKRVGPLQSSITHLYVKTNAPTGIKTMEEAKGIESICVLRGNVHHRYLERQGFGNIYPANSYASCVRMLNLERVSLTPLSNISSLIQGDQSSATRTLQKTPVLVMESKGYLAFSKETPDEVVEGWQTALDKLKASGRYDELIELYLWTE
jgi:polar amino acid transport system substrate-binding protein